MVEDHENVTQVLAGRETKVDKSRRSERGISLFELLIVMLIIVLIADISVPVLMNAREQARMAALIADSHEVYGAFVRYNVDTGSFPAMADFDKATLAPLTTDGYFEEYASFKKKLFGEEILVYMGLGDQFLLIFKPKHKPDRVMYIGHTDFLEDEWIDGVYMVVDGRIVKTGPRS